MVDVEPFVKPQFQDFKKMRLTFCFLLNKMEFDNDQNKWSLTIHYNRNVGPPSTTLLVVGLWINLEKYHKIS